MLPREDVTEAVQTFLGALIVGSAILMLLTLGG